MGGNWWQGAYSKFSKGGQISVVELHSVLKAREVKELGIRLMWNKYLNWSMYVCV